MVVVSIVILIGNVRVKLKVGSVVAVSWVGPQWRGGVDIVLYLLKDGASLGTLN